MGKILIFLGPFYLLAQIIYYFLAKREAFKPPSPPTYLPTDFPLFGCKNSPFHYYFKCPKPGFPTVILCHASSEDLGMVVQKFQFLTEKGIGLAACEYWGYGFEGENPDSKKTEKRVRRFYRFIQKELLKNWKIKNSKIISLGRSIGCYFAINGAREISPRLLVLENPFTSLQEIWAPFRFFYLDPFETLKALKLGFRGGGDTPLVFCWGGKDKFLKPHHREKFESEFHSDSTRTLLDPNSGHSEVCQNNPEKILEILLGVKSPE